jgi:hypothetical protein
MTIQFSVHRRVEIAQFSGIFDDSEVGVDSVWLNMVIVRKS